MGTWGIAAFENDGALDWMGDLPTGDGWAPVNEVFGDVELGEPPAPACTRALAAAELVAAARGHAAKQLPESAVSWLGAMATPPPEELVTRSRVAVERIRRTSELRALFQEVGELRSWSAELRRLETRLGKKPRPPGIERK